MCYHLHYLHFYFVFLSHYEALKRMIIFVVVKLIIVLTIHHYLGRVIGVSLYIMYDIYSVYIYVVIHKLDIELQK
jgi:hypothetical protein